MLTEDRHRLAERAAAYGWYHTIDLGGGVVTAGMFDHRPVVDRYLLPGDLTGARCLDVGTMDGFWAFEMERRGATEVIAADVATVDELDWPASWRPRVQTTLDETKKVRFDLAQAALGSRVQRVERSVYELDRDLGQFDLILCGDLLIHLKDPITAVQRMLSVCRGSTILCNPIKRFRLARGRALAEFDGIAEFQWWLLSEASIQRMMLAAGYARVERGRAFELPPAAGGPWKGLRGIMRGYVE
jgi:tRNA (mo5U34)-methyltransferase